MSSHKKRVYVIGGGTISHVRTHLALCAPAYGATAKELAELCFEEMPTMQVATVLTAMAGGGVPRLTTHGVQQVSGIFKRINDRGLETNEDVSAMLDVLVAEPLTKVIFMTAAMCDFTGTIVVPMVGSTYSGRDQPRLTSNTKYLMRLTPAEKVIAKIRKTRKDIFLIGCKTTHNATPDDQFRAGLSLCKKASCNLVLANDLGTKVNMIVTPEEARYYQTTDRRLVLRRLVEMANLRSQLTFTQSTVVDGELVPWDSDLVPRTLRCVVDWCIAGNAYKPVHGFTAGHFAVKLSDTEFLTSIRRSNFNNLKRTGLVRIVTDGPDTVLAYGAKPSVGGQSQRIVFHDHPEYDCIVHFHCPLKRGSQVPVVSQREYECGSHECGRNTSKGLKKFKQNVAARWAPEDEMEDDGIAQLSAVFLDQHGPNIVFHHSIDPLAVIQFIEANFVLSEKTDGLYYPPPAGIFDGDSDLHDSSEKVVT
jgi:ribulose-5-phosphate 4-epimerase/fuculose-1-phosphate aldolase